MNILFVSHSSRIAGAEKMLFYLLKSLPAEKFSCSVIFPGPGPLEKEISGLGVTAHIADLESWFYNPADSPGYPVLNFLAGLRNRVDKIKRIIENNSIDIVITNTLLTPDGAIASQIAGIPHIWWVHEILSTHKDLKPVLSLGMLYSTVASLSDLILCPSEAVRNELNSFIKNPGVPIERIYNGIEIQPPPQSLPGKKGKDVIAIGNISENKGISVLLEAACIVCKEMPDAVFNVIGPMEDKKYCREILSERKKAGLEKNFIFRGFQKDVYKFLDKSDVFVLPSVSEALGIVVLEAMNAGKPVVATKSGGATEMVVDGETGFLVPVNDSRAMAEKIIMLLENSELARKMGNAGYAKVKREFNMRQYVDRFAELLETNISRFKCGKKRPSETICDLIETLDSVGNGYQQILCSKSWRYTAPLRRVANGIRGLKFPKKR